MYPQMEPGLLHIGQPLRALAELKGREAVTICEGRVQSGGQLVSRIASLSTGLRVLGLRPGERVAIAALNSEWYLEWLLAVPCAGGIIAPLNHRWSEGEAGEAIRQIEARILVVDSLCMSWCTGLKASCPTLTRIVHVGSGSGAANSLFSAESIIQRGGCAPELRLLQSPGSIALICFTSGTTGRPKGVALSHRALTAQSLAKISVVGYSCNDVYLHAATMGHIGGISSALATVMAHGCHVILPKFLRSSVFASIDRYKVTTMIVVPTMINDMIAYRNNSSNVPYREIRPRGFTTVRTILNGAGSLSSSQLQAVQCLFPAARVLSAYGMTEACSSMTFLVVHDPAPAFEKVNLVKEVIGNRMATVSEGWHPFHLGGVCVGKPPPHVEMRIHPHKQMHVAMNCTAESDGNFNNISSLGDRFLSLGTSGNVNLGSGGSPSEELLLTAGNVLTRGVHVMDGYWGQALQTRTTLWEDGWLNTGDVGWMDESGQLWLLGREKDVIKSGGENVYAAEVEGVLMKHPAIMAAAVVGVPDDRLGEVVAAVVKLRQDHGLEYGKATKQDLLTLLKDHCHNQGLSRYKIPRFLSMQEDPFPVTSTGKVKKDQLRSSIIAELGARGHLTDPTSLISSIHSPPHGQKSSQSKL